MPLKQWILFFIALFSYRAVAAPLGELKKGIHLDLGAYQNHLKQRYEAPSGYENLVSSFSGYLRVRGTFLMGKKWGWEPSIGTRIPWRSGVDGTTRKFTSHIDFTFSYPLTSWFRFRFGPGVQWILSMGDGGEVVLNNGTSTSTFYSPGWVSNGFLVTAQTGVGFLLGSRFSLNLEVYGSTIFDRLRRNFDAVATLGWRL